MKPNKQFLAITLIVVAAVIGGAIPPLSKIALRDIPPLSFTFLRFLLAGLILMPIFWSRRTILKKQNIKQLILVSSLATINVTLFIFGVRRTTATISQMLYAGVPLVAGILSYSILKERLNVRKWLGIMIGFVGVCIIVLLPVLGQGDALNGDLLGNLIIIVAVVSFSLYSVLSKSFLKNYTPLDLTMFFVMTTVAIQLLLAPIEVNQTTAWWNNVHPWSVLALLYVGTFGTAMYYLLYQFAIQHATPVVASMILYLQPVFTIVWAAILLGERTTLGFVIGGILSLLGVALVTNFGKPEKNTNPLHTHEGS